MPRLVAVIRRPTVRLATAAVLLVGLAGYAAVRAFGPGVQEGPAGDVVVGEPGGAVLGGTPEPTEPLSAEAPSPEPAEPEPTPDPTIAPTPEATAEPTPEPVAAATPPPAAVAPAPATPQPTPIMVAMAVTPDQTVAAWYGHVERGEFDAAYALWSDRMKRGFARQGNLDGRWANTADVSIVQLYVVEQTQTYATVQIEFIETKDDGSSRRFIGWWELVRSGDGWLLDQPHF